jgi:hypothetical protein
VRRPASGAWAAAKTERSNGEEKAKQVPEKGKEDGVAEVVEEDRKGLLSAKVFRVRPDF